VDEGLPIAYPLLERDVPCYAHGGDQVGTVDHVVSAPEEDIFHGIVMKTDGGQRFVAAEDIASLHEHGVDLKLTTADCAKLEPPQGGAPAWRVHEAGSAPHRWQRWTDAMLMRDPNRRDWDEEN
jgi:hypothetical protein